MNSFALIDHLGWVLIHSLWQFSAIALVAGLVVWMLRRSSSSARYGVWVIALAVSVAAPVVTWIVLPIEEPTFIAVVPPAGAEAVIPVPIEPFAPAPPLSQDIMITGESSPTHAELRDPLLIAAAAPLEETPPALWSERLTALLRPWMAWIVAAWCMGVGLCSLRPLLGWHTLWRLRRVGVAPVSDEIRAALRRVSDQLRLRQTVHVLQSTLAQVPVVVGYLRPVILLPVSLLTNMPPSQLEAILAHELAHIRRHDFVVNLLQTLVETLFFYHPAVWWLSRQIRVEREHCCDDLVVAALGNRVEYGRALLAIEELRGERTLLALGAHDGSLLSRIRRIVGFNADRNASSPWMNLVFVMCLFSTIGLVSVLGWTASAEQEPDTTGEMINDDEIDVEKTLEPPKPVVAEWSAGRSLEFVGITKNTAPAKDGWLPSGLPIGDVGYWKSTTVLHSGNTSASYTENGPHPEPDADAIDFLFRFRGLKAQPSLTFDMPTRGSSYAHWPVAEPYDLRVSARKRPVQPPPGGTWTPPDGVVRVGLTDEPWGRYVKISPEGEVLDPIQPNELYASTYKLIDVRGSQPHDRMSTGKAIQIREPSAHIDPDDPDHRYVFEFRAIDTDGKEHWAMQWESRGVERTQWVDSQYGLAQPLPAGKTLSHYEYRLRPFRHWITFENVSIEPGPQTDVKFSMKSWPAVPVPLKVTNADGGPATMLAEKPDSFEILRVGQSRMLTSEKRVKEYRSFDPKVIDIRPIDPQTISITGVAAGLTVLTAINEANEVFQQLIEVTTEAAPPNADAKPIAFLPRDKRLKSRLTLKDRTPSIPVQIGVGHELEFPEGILSFEGFDGKTAFPRMYGNRILDISGFAPGKTTITVTTMDDEKPGVDHVWQIKVQVEQPTPLQLRKLFSTDGAEPERPHQEDARTSMLESLIQHPKLETFEKLLALADGKHPQVTELLDGSRRHSGNEKMGGEVKVMSNGQERFAIVSAKVIPLIEPSDVAVRVDPERRAECAFVFDMQGRLIDTIGGKMAGGDSLGGDDIHVVNLGPEEDWFVRVMNFEKRGELNYRSDYYRIANPVVKSFRFFNLPNACSWSNGPEKIPRQGRLHPAHPQAQRPSYAGVPNNIPVTTAAGVPTVSAIVWDGDRNRWVAAPSAFVKGLPLYEVDTTWSREFEPLEPQPGQLTIEGGIREHDHWYAWEAAVPDQGNATIALTIPQRDGPAKVIEKKLAPGRHTVQLQAKPNEQGPGVKLKLWIDEDQKDDFELPFALGEPLINHPRIVNVLALNHETPQLRFQSEANSIWLVHRLLKETTAALKFEIKLQASQKE